MNREALHIGEAKALVLGSTPRLGADGDTSDATAFVAFKTELVELVAISSVEFGRGDCTSTSSTSLL